MSLKNYIKNKKVNHFTFFDIEVFVKDPITNNISAKMVLNKIRELIPSFMLRGIDSIYIGNFEFLNKRKVQAMYENSSIFVTNKQDTLEDMIDDIVHEISHSLEEIYGSFIYSDGKIEREFLQKRKKLWMSLKSKNIDVDLSDFLKTGFSYKFDNFLYQEVGYPLLSAITANLFYSPYAATSLREYYANGFETFFLKEDIDRLKSISPTLYNKIANLIINYGEEPR